MRGRVLVDLRHVIAPCAARGAGLILHAIGHQDLSDTTNAFSALDWPRKLECYLISDVEKEFYDLVHHRQSF